MRNRLVLAAAISGSAFALLVASTDPAWSQASNASITLYELPGYLGRSVTVNKANPDLASVSFANRAQSVKVTGEWQACTDVNYAGTCQTLRASTKFLVGSAIVSLRTVADVAEAAKSGTATTAASGSTSAIAAAGTATAATAVDIDALDADAGTEGQDVAFFARPALGGVQVSAGNNDNTTGAAFCKQAGYSSSAYAGRARVQASNLIDIASKTKVRAFPLRDVLCRK